MASINKVILIGNLGADPESRHMPNSDQVTSIRIATTDTWRDKTTGEKKENTEWHRITFFGKLAEIAGQYLKKGSQVYVEGRLRTRKWTDQSGQERYTTEIVADQMQMLGRREGQGEPAKFQPNTTPEENDRQAKNFDTTEIVADQMQMLGRREGQGEPAKFQPNTTPEENDRQAKNFDTFDDDIPF